MEGPTLSEIHSLARISACVGLREEESLRKELQVALRQNIPAAVVREAILQTYLFAGYAATINAFIVFNDLIQPDAPDFLREKEGSLQTWKERGDQLCRTIYDDQFDKLVQNMNRLHPDLAEWMIWEGYGKVLSRPFLSPRVRELLIVAMTAVLGVERQFHSHVRGALHVGATAEELRSILQQVVRFLKPDAISSFQKILEDLIS